MHRLHLRLMALKSPRSPVTLLIQLKHFLLISLRYWFSHGYINIVLSHYILSKAPLLAVTHSRRQEQQQDQHRYPPSPQTPRFYRGIAVEAQSLISHPHMITKIICPALQEDEVTWLQPPLLPKEPRLSRQHPSSAAQALLGCTRPLEHTAERGFCRGSYATTMSFNKNTSMLFSPKRNSSTLHPTDSLQWPGTASAENWICGSATTFQEGQKRRWQCWEDPDLHRCLHSRDD